jgi:hypothetical protein
MKVKITERGWGGHFIGVLYCRFRRNTLVEVGDDRVVISTVGGYHINGQFETIGAFGRYYETMAFPAIEEGAYIEADTSNELRFDSEWQICADSVDDLPYDIDNKANEMHEAVVKEFTASMIAQQEKE